MHNFDIVSYCSLNYKDAYDFVIDSWIKNSLCNNITIYTDGDLIKSNNPKVKIIKLFNKYSNDWLIGTGRRLDALKHYINSKPQCDFFCFFDIDCYVVKPFVEIFDIMKPFFDLTVTRLFPRTENSSITSTAGLFFIKNNQAGCDFISDWKLLSDKYKQEKRGVEPYKISHVQYAFTKMVMQGYDLRKMYKVYVASEKIYNSENSIDSRWLKEIERNHPKILHFKGRRWRNQNLVKRIFSIVDQYTIK